MNPPGTGTATCEHFLVFQSFTQTLTGCPDSILIATFTHATRRFPQA